MELNELLSSGGGELIKLLRDPLVTGEDIEKYASSAAGAAEWAQVNGLPTDILENTVVMDLIFKSPSSVLAVYGNYTLMDVIGDVTFWQKIATDALLMDGLVQSKYAMTYVAKSSFALEILSSEQVAMTAIAASQAAMDIIISTQSAKDLITSKPVAINAIISDVSIGFPMLLADLPWLTQVVLLPDARVTMFADMARRTVIFDAGKAVADIFMRGDADVLAFLESIQTTYQHAWSSGSYDRTLNKKCFYLKTLVSNGNSSSQAGTGIGDYRTGNFQVNASGYTDIKERVNPLYQRQTSSEASYHHITSYYIQMEA